MYKLDQGGSLLAEKVSRLIPRAKPKGKAEMVFPIDGMMG
jgi:hypothetical protein